jgi:hypothetical protein
LKDKKRKVAAAINLGTNHEDVWPLRAGFLLRPFSDPEAGGEKFLRNVG